MTALPALLVTAAAMACSYIAYRIGHNDGSTAARNYAAASTADLLQRAVLSLPSEWQRPVAHAFVTVQIQRLAEKTAAASNRARI